MVTEWNRKASEMLGYTREETMGKHLVENFIQKETQSLVASVLSKAHARGLLPFQFTVFSSFLLNIGIVE